MSSSISTRARVSKQRSRQTNSKRESKSEVDVEKPKASSVREVMQKAKSRSSSLSKQDQVKTRDSPQKSQSVDRSVSNRHGSQNISIKKSLVDTRKANIGTKKSTLSTSNSRNQNASKIVDVTIPSSSNQAIKGSEKSSRSPMKGPSGKTNVEIAKSFVRNARDTKTKKESSLKNSISKSSNSKNKYSKGSNSKNSSEKSKSGNSSKKVVEDAERPRTSTIHKGPPEFSNILLESNEKELDKPENLESEMKNSDAKSNEDDDKSNEEDDDKLSYEEDFEDYDSDFEESDTDSVSDTESSETVSYEEENVLDAGIDRNSVSGNSTSSNSENVFVDQKDKYPKVRKSNEKTFLQMSDRSFLSSKKLPDSSTEKKIIKPSHSFINFASAVEEEEKKKYSNRVLKRASDLLEIITLSKATYNHIDIPPMKYDTYIRFFGKTDAKQVFVQTENFEDEEIQTDEIEIANKWTQNPPNDNFGSGGDITVDGTIEIDGFKSLFNSQNVKLSSFLQNCSKVILTILNEDYPVSNEVQTTQRRSELFYSDGYYTLPPQNFLKDVPVLNVYCSSGFNNYVLTIHDGIIKVPHTNDERGVICVWNFHDCRKPEHILIAHSQPTCATFGPGGNNIVLAGMVDGTVLLWDLSDNSQTGLDERFSLKSPTYSTAVILGNESHHSCIVAIQALLNHSKNYSESPNFTRPDESKNFHVLTLEDMGIINIWVVVEVLKPDFSGLETDLGLSPGGKLRLVRSSSIFLYDLSALQEIQKINIRTFDFRLVPFDSNRILVTTDAGIVLHVNRQGTSAEPRFYSNDLELSSEVRCIDCSPHNEDLFLIGCSDGSAKLYNLKLVHPVLVFLLAAKGDPVTLIQWSPIHPAMFAVLSSSSNLYLWNLLEDSLHPINSYHFPDSRVTWFSFCNLVDTSSSHKSSRKCLHMFISREDGETEVHVFKHEVSEKEYSRQLQFMKNL